MRSKIKIGLSLSVIFIALTACQSTHHTHAGKGSQGIRIPASDIPLHPLENPRQGVTPMTLDQENQMIRGLTDGILSKITITRDAHPKAHGCNQNATLTVNKKLRRLYQEGVFAKPGQSYGAIVRFSSGSSNPKADDRMPSSQGMAVKILLPNDMQARVPDLAGEEYYLPKETYKTFDIITINRVQEFVVNDIATYPFFFKASGMAEKAAQEAMAAGKTPEEIKQITGKIFIDEYVAKVSESIRPTVGKLLQTLTAIKAENLLAETYHSWVPYAFDATRAVKYSFKPCSKIKSPHPVAVAANFLGAQLHEELADSKNSGCFDLYAQFHESTMPSVENAALAWGEASAAKLVKLGRLKLSQNFTAPEYCEALSYNPSHSLPNQNGIGAIQRARRIIYAEISNLRNKNVRDHH